MLHPETVNWLKVHDRCVQGDKAAWEEIVEHFLPSLSQRLFRSRPDLDRHLIVESAEEALLDYWKNPQRFDATLGVPLGCWLHILARGHQSRLLRKERAYHKKEQAIGIEDKNFAQNATILSRKRPRIGYLLAEEVEQMNCSEEEIKIVSQFSSKERVALVLLKRESFRGRMDSTARTRGSTSGRTGETNQKGKRTNQKKKTAGHQGVEGNQW
jgi:hypothetical protein